MGNAFRVERARGPVWYAKYRLPDGRQVWGPPGPSADVPALPSAVVDPAVRSLSHRQLLCR